MGPGFRERQRRDARRKARRTRNKARMPQLRHADSPHGAGRKNSGKVAIDSSARGVVQWWGEKRSWQGEAFKCNRSVTFRRGSRRSHRHHQDACQQVGQAACQPRCVPGETLWGGDGARLARPRAGGLPPLHPASWGAMLLTTAPRNAHQSGHRTRQTRGFFCALLPGA
jgi:hypothetical protein